MDVIELLKKHEGFSATAYVDTRGNLTIGYGQKVGLMLIDQPLATTLLQSRIVVVKRQLGSLDFFDELDEVRQAVLIDMAYQLGFAGLMEFKKMLDALHAREFLAAAAAMLASKWAIETPGRAHELAAMMEGGKWPS